MEWTLPTGYSFPTATNKLSLRKKGTQTGEAKPNPDSENPIENIQLAATGCDTEQCSIEISAGAFASETEALSYYYILVEFDKPGTSPVETVKVPAEFKVSSIPSVEVSPDTYPKPGDEESLMSIFD